MNVKRVLMIAFHYPPDSSSSGMLRTLKFSKYLPQYGWKPSVITVDESHYEQCDTVLLKQVPSEVEICRTPAINTKQTLSIGGRYFGATAIPDRFIGWLPYAVAEGMRLIRAHRVEALYSTSPLGTAHLIASVLKRISHLPWIADFRDPWTEPEIASDTRALLFRTNTWLERRVLRRADRLVFSTAGLRDYVIAHADRDVREKAAVITNGYDEEDFRALPAVTPDRQPIVITHTGLVDDSYRSPYLMLEALAGLIRAGEAGADEIRVQFVGGGGYVESDAFRARIAALGLQHVVAVMGRVSYSECLEIQMRSHILLLLQCGEDTRTLIPAKAFEYLRIGRPILAVTPESATSELFGRVGGAEVVDSGDKSGMTAALRGLVAGARSQQWTAQVDTNALQAFGRKQLTAQLAALLDGVTKSAAVRSREFRHTLRSGDRLGRKGLQ